MISQGKSYKIWVDNMEKQSNDEEMKAEKYARYLKKREVDEAAKSRQVLQQNINNVLKGISKYKALKGEEQTKVPASSD